jgi:hypothetical protein
MMEYWNAGIMGKGLSICPTFQDPIIPLFQRVNLYLFGKDCGWERQLDESCSWV